MIRVCLALAVLALAAACAGREVREERADAAAPALAPTVSPTGGVTVLRDRRGGNIAAQIAERNRLEASGDLVVIVGRLSSASTIFATLPNACLARNVRLGFHRPIGQVGGRSFDVGDAAEVGVRLLAPYYSGEARRLWEEEWSRTSEFTNLSARDFTQIEARARLCTRGERDRAGL